MRKPVWERAPGALAVLLNSGAPLEKCDLYTITLASGQVLRWTSAERPIEIAGDVWVLGPGIERTRCKWSIGGEVDTMSITLTADSRRTYPIGDLPLLAYISAGGFGRARVQLLRAFWGRGDAGPVGTLNWFTGFVAEVPEVDRRGAQLSIKSALEVLNQMVPREVYQAQCIRTVYDSECGAARAAFQIVGVATSAGRLGRTQFDAAPLGKPDGYFDLGTLTFTSGANTGVSRSVKALAGGQVSLLAPLPAPISAGDAFVVLPGCDGLQATCSGKFNNLAAFKGQPYIPQPETVL